MPGRGRGRTRSRVAPVAVVEARGGRHCSRSAARRRLRERGPCGDARHRRKTQASRAAHRERAGGGAGRARSRRHGGRRAGSAPYARRRSAVRRSGGGARPHRLSAPGRARGDARLPRAEAARIASRACRRSGPAVRRGETSRHAAASDPRPGHRVASRSGGSARGALRVGGRRGGGLRARQLGQVFSPERASRDASAAGGNDPRDRGPGLPRAREGRLGIRDLRRRHSGEVRARAPRGIRRRALQSGQPAARGAAARGAAHGAPGRNAGRHARPRIRGACRRSGPAACGDPLRHRARAHRRGGGLDTRGRRDRRRARSRRLARARAAHEGGPAAAGGALADPWPRRPRPFRHDRPRRAGLLREHARARSGVAPRLDRARSRAVAGTARRAARPVAWRKAGCALRCHDRGARAPPRARSCARAAACGMGDGRRVVEAGGGIARRSAHRAHRSSWRSREADLGADR